MMDATDEIETLRREARHWKANHSHMVARCAMLSQRPDLPVDRIGAYRELVRLQQENARLLRQLLAKQFPIDSLWYRMDAYTKDLCDADQLVIARFYNWLKENEAKGEQ